MALKTNITILIPGLLTMLFLISSQVAAARNLNEGEVVVRETNEVRDARLVGGDGGYFGGNIPGNNIGGGIVPAIGNIIPGIIGNIIPGIISIIPGIGGGGGGNFLGGNGGNGYIGQGGYGSSGYCPYSCCGAYIYGTSYCSRCCT